MNIQRILILSLLLSLAFIGLNAQVVQDSVLITPEMDLGEVASPYAFTFLHEKPQHKVDLWISNLLHTPNYNDERMNKRVDELGAIRSKQALYLLYLCCCQPMTVKEPTVFTDLAMAIRTHGGYKTLNTYFLSRAVPETLAEAEFQQEVIARCQRLPMPLYLLKK